MRTRAEHFGEQVCASFRRARNNRPQPAQIWSAGRLVFDASATQLPTVTIDCNNSRDISDIRANFEDRKCLTVQEKIVYGHPDAIYFLQISRSEFCNSHRRLHQQSADECNGDLTPTTAN